MGIEIYVSTDIEADGPIPGVYSMLSFGSVAYSPEGAEIGSFTRNLKTLPGARTDQETMSWWASQPAAWVAHRESPIEPLQAMQEYVAWVDTLPGRPVFVAYPTGVDWTFMYWYMKAFVGKSPFGFDCLDVKTYAMCTMQRSYYSINKRVMPPRWWAPKEMHTHIALEDAREQGRAFMRMFLERTHMDKLTVDQLKKYLEANPNWEQCDNRSAYQHIRSRTEKNIPGVNFLSIRMAVYRIAEAEGRTLWEVIESLRAA